MKSLYLGQNKHQITKLQLTYFNYKDSVTHGMLRGIKCFDQNNTELAPIGHCRNNESDLITE